MNTITIAMKRERFCKNSVVFKPAGVPEVDSLRAIYLMNEAYDKLDKPEIIKLTIESVKS